MITATQNIPITDPEHRVRKYMVTNIPIIKPTDTLADVQAQLWKNPSYDTTKYLFVTNKKKNLIGIISFKDLFRHSPDTEVASIMKTDDIVTVSPSDNDEQTVYIAIRYGLAVVPVVEFGKLIGAVPSIKLLTILHYDSAEDIAEAGASHVSERKVLDDVLTQSIFTSVIQRAPWLMVGLVGGLGAAVIIEHFEAILAANIVLVSYIPLVVFLAGAISAQIQMFFVRDLATLDNLPFLKYVSRQAIVVAGLGVAISALLYAVNTFVFNLGATALVISIATLAAVASALLTGIGVPLILSKILRDPASATPPIAIITSDLLTVLLYFIVAGSIL